MANHNCKAVGLQQSTFIVDLSQIPYDDFRYWPRNDTAFADSTLIGPLRMAGNSMGLHNDGRVDIDIVDATGVRLITHSPQTILRLIESFVDGDRDTLLAMAAVHYGLNPLALIGRPA